MIIAHFMPGMRDPGGIGAYIARLAAAQTAAGHEVVLFDRVGRVAANDSAGRLEVTRDDADLLAQTKRRQVDILHLHTAIDQQSMDVPVIRTMHGHWPYCPSGSKFLERQNRPCDRAYTFLGCTWGHLVDHCGSVRPLRFAEDFQRTWNEMQHLKHVPVLAISEFVKTQMVRSGYAPELIDVLYLPAPDVINDLEAPSQDLEDGPPRFVFGGRLVPQKGLEWLIRSAAIVKSEFHLDVAGDGPLLARLIELSKRLGLEKSITFHGWLDENRMFDLIRQARAMVFPSVWHEPAGLITLEAAAHGKAVIASRVGGIPEYAERLGNALLVSPNDVAGLASAIEKLVRSPSTAESLGNAGRAAAAQSMSLTRHSEQLHLHYEKAIANHRTRR